MLKENVHIFHATQVVSGRGFQKYIGGGGGGGLSPSAPMVPTPLLSSDNRYRLIRQGSDKKAVCRILIVCLLSFELFLCFHTF